jgi:hypothetical protein
VNTYLAIQTNVVLATIILQSLSSIKGTFVLRFNPLLTLLHLPMLTFISEYMNICMNNAVFVIPTGLPNAPIGGLVVTGSYKGTYNCKFQSGTVCSTVKCP